MALEAGSGWTERLLLLLNGSNSLFFRPFDDIGITSTVAWIPVAVSVLFYVLVKNNSVREVGLIVLFLALSILFGPTSFLLLSVNLTLPVSGRLPDPLLMYSGRRGGWLSGGGRYGFISSHAANTFAVCIFLALLVGNVWMTFSLVLWAALCSYSRIYLGMYSCPGDIVFRDALGAVGRSFHLHGMRLYFAQDVAG